MFAPEAPERLHERLERSPGFRQGMVHREVLPARPGLFMGLPSWLPPRLAQGLVQAGRERLYRHQRLALDAVHEGRDVLVVTPTASGKSLCYQLPCLALEPEQRALWLFPTKALARDQLVSLTGLAEAAGVRCSAAAFDGDTARGARSGIRDRARILLTNPDMLHRGILPQHPRWQGFLSQLRYVVLDEVHRYRGLFGSHVANVLRRLQRLCAHYGGAPRFICCSATIANPEQQVEQLIGRKPALVGLAANGAPRARRRVYLYNPPRVSGPAERRPPIEEAVRIGGELIAQGAQTLIFGRSRRAVELIARKLKQRFSNQPGADRFIASYRGGYLPLLRRRIESGLRQGLVRGVVATNALELGIDIGGLDAVVMAGWPGSVASAWQQIGRAGRRRSSLAVLIAGPDPIDQYLVQKPAWLFSAPPEHARLDPDNLFLYVDHVRCAAAELPFSEGERFGGVEVEEVLDYLADAGEVRRPAGGGGRRWRWAGASEPWSGVALRSLGGAQIAVLDQTRGSETLAVCDRASAPRLLHPGAVYLVEGSQYRVERLDLERHEAHVRRIEVDYYTVPRASTKIEEVEQWEERSLPAGASLQLGEVRITSQVTGYRRFSLSQHEFLGQGRVELPPSDWETTATWLAWPPDLSERLALDPEQLQLAMASLGRLLHQLAALQLLSERGDLGRHVAVREGSLWLYDAVPGGVGFAGRLYEDFEGLLAAARERAAGCDCSSGCPGCVGPGLVSDDPEQDLPPLRETVVALVDALTGVA